MSLIPRELIPTSLVERSERPPLVIEPVKRPPRLWLLITPLSLLKVIGSILWLRITGKFSEKIFAERVREFLETMGGLWIKAGQLISLRRDAFSEELCDELAKLLDQS